MGMYAVKHVNRMDTHIPPKKNAIQARSVVDLVVEVLVVSLVDRNTFNVMIMVVQIIIVNKMNK